MPGDGAGLLMNPGAAVILFLIMVVMAIVWTVIDSVMNFGDDRDKRRRRDQEIDEFSRSVDARREEWLRKRSKSIGPK